MANAMHEASFRRILQIDEVEDVLGRARGRHAAAVLRAAVAMHVEGSAGTRSLLEHRVLRELERAGAPGPQVNAGVRVAGEWLEVDLHWPSHRLCVEVDGPGHRRPRTSREDRRRDQLLRESGWEVIRVGARDVPNAAARIVGKLGGVAR